MGSENLHERYEDVRPETRELHRAIISLMEELEAVDWYTQRADATEDEELKAVILHHRDEEIEHAMMNLEWIRRRSPKFDENARTYLFSEGPITAVEEAAKEKEVAGSSNINKGSGSGKSSSTSDGSLGIGSLKLT